MRLLPKDESLGWTPYAWLVYLVFLLQYPIMRGATAAEWALNAAAIGVFLVLYFSCFWMPGRRKLWPIAGIALLGAVFAPLNPGAASFFIYAACFLGDALPPRTAFAYLAGLLALMALETWVLGLPVYFWGPALFFSPLLGAVNIHFANQGRMTRKLLKAQEEIERLAKIAERERIARDLHDLLGHTLSSIVLKSELASKIAGKDADRAVRQMQEVEMIAREALAEVRATIRGFAPTGLDTGVEQAKQVLETAGIEVRMNVSKPELAPAEEAVLALALREAVTNVVRHSSATYCRLILQSTPDGCELEVIDNGTGSNANEGFGLSGMRHRVESLGGTLERDGTKGTRLRIWIPTQKARASGAA
jgi:two-component system sensor histidine kinase DesK